jgi:hypothetical protein
MWLFSVRPAVPEYCRWTPAERMPQRMTGQQSRQTPSQY